MEVIIAFSVLFFLLLASTIQNRSLQKRICVVESTQTQLKIDLEQVKADNLLLTKDQEEWLKKNKADVQKTINKLSEELKQESQKLNSDQEKWIVNNRSEFDKRLAQELEKACEKIKFDEIEYKKTITKKRKEFNRKNGANAKPQRQWRYIDDDTSPSMQ